MIILATALAWTIPLPAGADGENPILAGPMVGHVSPGEARLWVRLAPGAVVEAEARQGGRRIEPTRIRDLGQGFHLLEFEGFRPGTGVEARLTARLGEAVARETATFRTYPVPARFGKVRIAFTSCNQDSRYERVPVMEAIAEERPDAAIHLGDNSYFVVGDGEWSTSGPRGDWSSAELMMARHLRTRTNPDLQRLIRSVPNYAVWDDHDYGPNNSDREFPLKAESLAVFKMVWANPGYGTGESPGVFSAFRIGPAEVFLLDDRYYKYVATEERPDVPEEERTIWGEAQLRWLLAGLKASTAPIKILANGTQMISRTERGEGHWQEARRELDRLLDFLREHRIGGVVILSGDRHYSESLALRREGGPTIVEFTSSPVQQNQDVGPLDVRHAAQLWGMRGNSYGLVTIEIGRDGEGTVRFEARDVNNRVPIVGGQRCATTWALRDLVYH